MFRAETFSGDAIVKAIENFIIVAHAIFTRLKHPHAVQAHIVDATELAPHADRPRERHDVHV